VTANALAGRCILVAGATGTVGGWVTAGMLERGATVVAIGRSQERLTALADRFEPPVRARLLGVRCDLSSLADAAPSVDAIAAAGFRVNAVVAALGRWWEGTNLVELPMDDWLTILNENLTSHFVAARTFAPILDPATDPSYVTMAGVAALKAVASSGAVSVTGAAQQMLLRGLAAESADSGVRYHQLLLTTPVVAPDDAETRSAHPDWILGPAVAGHVARILRPDFDRHTTFVQEPVPYLPHDGR
jgi:NAD(P)-dependent dehydrogenase (short-subunit alcohol dehydrogenase family)